MREIDKNKVKGNSIFLHIYTVNSRVVLTPLKELVFFYPRTTPFEELFWSFTRIYFDSWTKGRLKRLIEESKSKSTLQKSCFDPYFGSFLLLFRVISTPMLCHCCVISILLLYYGSFLYYYCIMGHFYTTTVLWVISTLILGHSYPN